MIQPKYDPQEALERIKLMMKYDMSKTLTEQTEDPNKEIAMKIFNATTRDVGTEENDLVTAIEQIKSPAQLKQVDDALVAINGNVGGIANTINNELGNGDIETARKIETHLKGIGANVTANINPNVRGGKYTGGFSITYDGTTNENKTDGWAKYPCVINLAKSKGLTPDSMNAYTIGNFRYFSNGRKQDIKLKKLGEYTCNDSEFKKSIKTTKYTDCTGTYKPMCKSPVIAKVQACLSITPALGNYGRKTYAKLTELGYPNGFTDADVEKICGSVNVNTPKVEPKTGVESPQVEPKTGVESPQVEPKTGVESPKVSGEEVYIDPSDPNF